MQPLQPFLGDQAIAACHVQGKARQPTQKLFHKPPGAGDLEPMSHCAILRAPVPATILGPNANGKAQVAHFAWAAKTAMNKYGGPILTR